MIRALVATVVVLVGPSAAVAQAIAPRVAPAYEWYAGDRYGSLEDPRQQVRVASIEDSEKGAPLWLWALMGAVAGGIWCNISSDEDGLTSTELIGALAGASTGVVFGLVWR
jgi:hypothetical protein